MAAYTMTERYLGGPREDTSASAAVAQRASGLAPSCSPCRHRLHCSLTLALTHQRPKATHERAQKGKKLTHHLKHILTPLDHPPQNLHIRHPPHPPNTPLLLFNHIPRLPAARMHKRWHTQGTSRVGVHPVVVQGFGTAEAVVAYTTFVGARKLGMGRPGLRERLMWRVVERVWGAIAEGEEKVVCRRCGRLEEGELTGSWR